MSTAVVILAAGKGTRMQSDLPKVLHPLAQVPLLAHAIRSARFSDPDHMVIVAGHGFERVFKAANTFAPDATVVEQTEQLGTGHAVAQAKSQLADFDGDVIVLYGDTPFISDTTIEAITAARANADLVVLGFHAADPGRYGRLVTQGDRLERIVEFKDATDAERAITLCNSGVMAAKAQDLFAWIDQIDNSNASGEYYLTDCVAIAVSQGKTATVVLCDEAETLGVNSRAELAQAETAFQAKMRADMLENGVTLYAPESVYFSYDTAIGRDCLIEQNVVFGPDVTVESGATIRAFSHLEGCHVSRDAVVGPYARLRPGAELSEGVKIGNFVEVKNALIGEGSKVNHLSYIGDADIGKGSNIGAGTITCNYDGVMKHRTEIGDNVFVGSNTMLVAPVSLGNNSMTASGSVITKDVAATDLAISRAEQSNKKGMAIKLFEMLKKRKAKRDLEKS
ncbi:MAG: bifunctional UDP-N-acetylglucosamine diphosphorylase/glucosamine-1-phosphate N-acetyltransferase GlmU [Paracoccaceae bacterium]